MSWQIKNDLEVLKVVSESESVREVLLEIYDNPNPPTHSYKRISKLMITTGVKFKNGEIYIHPSLETLYEDNKNKKPIIKFTNA
jgi:hypothetical protein